MVEHNLYLGRGENRVPVRNTGTQVRIEKIVREPGQTVEISRSGSTGSFGGRVGTRGETGRGSQFVNRRVVATGGGMAGGEFTQMGHVAGRGGGVKRIIDTNVKRIPGGEASFDATGGISLASLGLGGAEGKNIIRQSIRMEAAGPGTYVSEGTDYFVPQSFSSYHKQQLLPNIRCHQCSLVPSLLIYITIDDPNCVINISIVI